MKNLKFQYVIGKSCFSLEYNAANNIQFLDKQFELSIPLITGVHIKYQKKKKEYLQKIYVGKEIEFSKFVNQEDLLDKYDLELDDLADVAVLGYDRACLLNFKKYDSVIVGVEKDAIIVPDYYALKKLIYRIQNQVTLN